MSQPNPYPGLRPFRIDEDHLFFGREEQVRDLIKRLDRSRFVAVVGASGSGKSSLVRCGMLSELQRGALVSAGSHWEMVVMQPGANPARNLAQALIDADVIICSNVLEHLDDDVRLAVALKQKARQLLCITVPFQESPLNPEHVRAYDSGHFDGALPGCTEHVFPARYWSEYGRRHVHLHLKNLGRRLRGRPVRSRKLQIMYRLDLTI